MTGVVRIVVEDPTGCGLPLAIGLCELGHRVTWRGPQRAAGGGPDTTPPLCRELIARFFGAPAATVAPADECDLYVAVDTFADILTTLGRGLDTGAPMDLTDPFVPTQNPLVYPGRLRRWLDLAARAQQLAVVDLSDAAAPREVAFEMLPGATLLAREALPGGPWRPFPFLYNQVLLAIEHLCAERDWWIPSAARRTNADWTFCGTIDHPRYGGRRAAALAHAVRRWPSLRGHVAVAAPFAEVVGLLQATRFCLDLPGAGELCFRVHEALALGTPLLRLEPNPLPLAPGVRSLLTCEPGAPMPDAETVRACYREHLAPRAAAAALLAACAATAAPARRGHVRSGPSYPRRAPWPPADTAPSRSPSPSC